MTDARDAALRPLHAVGDARSSLREGIADPAEARATVLRVGDAVEASLRRLLRDDSGQSLETRLRALDPEEIAADEVVSALRHHDRISIELAAAFHDLLAVRERLRFGADASGSDADMVCNVADRTEREIQAARVPSAAAAAASRDAVPGTPEQEPDEPRSLSRTHRGLPWPWLALAVGALLVIVLSGVLIGRRGGARMDEAIAMFRTGDYERATVQFERHAADRPDDPTPRLYLARIHRRSGRFDDAGDQLRLALEAAPDDALIHRELGLLLLDLGRADAAVSRFRAAVERDPQSAEGWLGLVRALRESGQDDAANRVLARAPAEVRALIQRTPAQTPR